MSEIFTTGKCPVAPKIKKKFLFFEFEKEGVHEYKLSYIYRFMGISDDYTVGAECIHCGKTIKRHFVEYEELIRYGLKPFFLKRITGEPMSIKKENWREGE